MNDAEAKRVIQQTASDPQTALFQFPDDFTLFKVASFDSSSGTITPLDVFVSLGNLLPLVTPIREDVAEYNVLRSISRMSSDQLDDFLSRYKEP